MAIFKRIQTTDQKQAAEQAPQEVSSVTVEGQSAPVKGYARTSNEKPQIDVATALFDALGKFGVKPKMYHADWARIPAVWRGSVDTNIAVNLKSGTTTDWSNNKNYTFTELMELLEHTPGNVSLMKTTSSEIQNNALQRIRDAQSLWKKGTPLSSETALTRIAKLYLEETRGIPADFTKRIYSQIRVTQGDYGGAILILPIFSPSFDNKLIGVQRIFLNAEGKKISDRPKAMLGTHFTGTKAGGFLIAGDNTRFHQKEIALVEGFETGLAVHVATGMPVYVLYDTNGLKRVCVEYLSSLGVTSVLIAADNDDPDKYGVRAGQDASKEVAERIIKETSAPTRIALPPRKYTEGKPCDWLNVWNKDPAATSRLILAATPFVADPEEKPQVRTTMRGLFKAR